MVLSEVLLVVPPGIPIPPIDCRFDTQSRGKPSCRGTLETDKGRRQLTGDESEGNFVS